MVVIRKNFTEDSTCVEPRLGRMSWEKRQRASRQRKQHKHCVFSCNLLAFLRLTHLIMSEEYVL